ncbi:hypothetical protein [Nocardiopsis lucentensis]|uniref:hypothetical protein n=1 Tax=Nocardiopsis lucentensis TaxID=53441 RepID=UPI0003493DFF|nr:hypothetical protein [Nocardiopsis lucentensis]
MALTHGFIATRKRGCNCPDCRQAGTEYDREYYRRRRLGLPTTDLVDAEPVRHHVIRLMELGWSWDGLAKVTGVAHIDTLLYGRPSENQPPLKRIGGLASRRILAVPLELVPTLKQIDAAGSRRRSQALQTLGYSVAWQAQQAQMARSSITRLLNGSSERILARHAVALRDVYDAHWNATAPLTRHSKAVRTLAREKGYLPPLAWDDDLIDLPEDELAAEVARRAADMDSAELHRCYRARLEGDRSPEIVAGADRYLELRRTGRRKGKAA